MDNFKTRVAQSWNDQTAVVYDSFERYSECRYFAVIDQDEFFIPGKYRTLGEMFVSMSLCMRKPTICIGENKDADQLRGDREADQRLCFRYKDSTLPLLLKSEISSF